MAWPRARRSRSGGPVGRRGRRRPRVHRDGRRLLQGAHPVRPPDRYVPGRPTTARNMAVATELATSVVWDAARASATGGDQLTYAAAVAATLAAAPAADLCANLNTQVHGGIAITWEHDAQSTRRATTLLHYLDAAGAAEELTDLPPGIVLEKAVELPREADRRPGPRGSRQSIKDLPADEQRTRLIETGYVMPHGLCPTGVCWSGGTARHRAGVRGGRHHPPGLRDHGVEHPHDHPVRHPGPDRPLGHPGAEPGRDLVSALQRARRRLRRRGRQDQGHPRRWLARQRPEGVDQRR